MPIRPLALPRVRALPSGSSAGPTLQRRIPNALSWLQPLPWDSALLGQPIAAVSALRVPLGLPLPELVSGVRSAGLLHAPLQVPLDHHLAPLLRRAGYQASMRRRQYVQNLTQATHPLPQRAGWSLEQLQGAPAEAALVHLAAQTLPNLPVVGGPLGQHHLQRYLDRCLSGEQALAVWAVFTPLGQPAGLLTVAQRGTAAEVGLLAVAGAWRRQGVARWLLQAARTTAQAHQLPKLVVHAEADNLPLCQLLQREGLTAASQHLFVSLHQLRQEVAA